LNFVKLTADIIGTALKRGWNRGDSRSAAALSFYAIFTLVPFFGLVAILGRALLNLENSEIQEKVFRQVSILGGPVFGNAVKSFITNSALNGSSGGLISTIALLFSSLVTFSFLRQSLNCIWDDHSKPEESLSYFAEFKLFLKGRWLSFVALLFCGSLLWVSSLAGWALEAAGDLLNLPNFSFGAKVTKIILSLSLYSALFFVLYRFLPDRRLKATDLLVGSLISSALFAVGNSLFAVYLKISYSSVIAAIYGTILILFVWVYYSAQIFFFGAELTYVLSKRKLAN